MDTFTTPTQPHKAGPLLSPVPMPLKTSLQIAVLKEEDKSANVTRQLLDAEAVSRSWGSNALAHANILSCLNPKTVCSAPSSWAQQSEHVRAAADPGLQHMVQIGAGMQGVVFEQVRTSSGNQKMALITAQ